MNLFEHSDFRAYLQAWLSTQPRKGRGLIRAWALEFRVHPTLLSQILSGKRSLSLELAERVGEKLGLTEAELEYFFLLVEHNQAGTERLRAVLDKRVRAAQARARQISSRVGASQEVSEAKKAEFYSSWLYAGVRNLTAIEGLQTVDALSAHLQLPKAVVARVVDFLLEAGLCVRERGRLGVGPQITHVGAESPLVHQHHRNWRLHSCEKMLLRRDEDLFVTIPMSLSKADAKKLRARIPVWIEEVSKLVGPSKSEVGRCLSVDFFEL